MVAARSPFAATPELPSVVPEFTGDTAVSDAFAFAAFVEQPAANADKISAKAKKVVPYFEKQNGISFSESFD